VVFNTSRISITLSSRCLVHQSTVFMTSTHLFLPLSVGERQLFNIYQFSSGVHICQLTLSVDRLGARTNLHCIYSKEVLMFSEKVLISSLDQLLVNICSLSLLNVSSFARFSVGSFEEGDIVLSKF
jgi:hypothetical protein